ncbi:hypothetical protein CEXT_86301 [Caerostris extrusa]|uniref:Uncharacterized protein n=1 Tax=Caerostris extrusa TaxID=172846 RepID=A0AAV4T369_CAEEX|nr:hypothetical protein CEXT_86301 [Caerostris extrusa]
MAPPVFEPQTSDTERQSVSHCVSIPSRGVSLALNLSNALAMFTHPPRRAIGGITLLQLLNRKGVRSRCNGSQTRETGKVLRKCARKRKGGCSGQARM